MNVGTVHVVGAGVAGLSAAVRLIDAGAKVVVHEAARAAGGRCRSYFDQSLDLVIDNGNHLLLSGNAAALDYLGRVGGLTALQVPSAPEFDFADLASGERWRIRPNLGRIPWWLFDRSRRAPGTALREYFAPLSTFFAPATATLGETMSCKGPLYDRLWRPLLLAGLNTEPPEGSAALAAAMLRETLGAGGRACRPLIAAQGLSRAFVDPALAFLEARGTAVRFGRRLRGVAFADSRAAALEFEGETLALGRDDAVVMAVPPWSASELLPDISAPDEFRAIVNAHFRIAPPPGQPAILGVVNSLTEWLFAYPDRLSTTISGADRLLERSREDLAAEFLARSRGADRAARGPAALANC